jgi:DNA polymerase III, epsilon subunit and related 3''-5'' exonucleases
MKELLNSPSLIKDPSYNKKVLLFDIENTPLVSYTWGIWEQDVIEVKAEWYILCFSYKWLGEKETHCIALPDFKGYKKGNDCEEKLIKKLWELFDEAEILIAHNGDNFDIKKANARFIQWGLEPPSPYKSIDTLKLARRNFKFDSNKLDYLGQYLKLGRKVPHTGKHLWFGCMDGDKSSWDLMKKYNKQDVILLEKVYYKLRGWVTVSTNMNLILGGIFNCPKCGSNQVVKKGFNKTKTAIYQAWKCLNCGGWSQGSNISSKKETILK